MCLYGTSQPSSHGPKWAEGATPGPTPMEPFLRGHQAPSVARKMPTCLSHQSTPTINHPLPTHTVAMLWGSCSSQSPSQGLAEAAGTLLGCQDLVGRWSATAKQAGNPNRLPEPQPFSLPVSFQGWERPAHPGTLPLSPMVMGQGFSCFLQIQAKSQVPFICRTSVLNVSERLWLCFEEHVQGVSPAP